MRVCTHVVLFYTNKCKVRSEFMTYQRRKGLDQK